MNDLSRRHLLMSLAPAPSAPLIDTHVHLFSDDQQRFPYHRNAVYRPPAQTLEAYVAFAVPAGISHTVIVHPEPYQDDHRYLEYCFAHEPRPGFFKGTCLFDPIAGDTPSRMAALVKANPGRIVALRVHVTRVAGSLPTTSGAIRDRDLRDPAMRTTWHAAHALGLAIQMHLVPVHAPDVASLAVENPETIVILDHLARAGEGSPDQYDRVLQMAKLKNVIMKFSGVNYSSKEPSPFRDAKPLVKRTFDAFGPDRMMWGGLGMNEQEFRLNSTMFDEMFDFTSASDRAKIRGLTAARVFHFPK